jgi:ATP-dependent Lon protease
LKRVLLPARNRKDLEDVAEETRKQLELMWLERVEDAMEAALEPGAPERQRALA